MEAVTKFLIENALIIEAVLTVVITVLGFVAFKSRDAVVTIVSKIKEILKDGKIESSEVKDLLDTILAAVFAKK